MDYWQGGTEQGFDWRYVCNTCRFTWEKQSRQSFEEFAKTYLSDSQQRLSELPDDEEILTRTKEFKQALREQTEKERKRLTTLLETHELMIAEPVFVGDGI